MALVTIVVPCAIEPAPGASAWRPGQDAASRRVGRREHLERADHAGCRIEGDEVGERPSDVDPDPDAHRLMLAGHRRPRGSRRDPRPVARVARDANARCDREEHGGSYDASSGATRGKLRDSDRIRAKDRRARRVCQRPRPAKGAPDGGVPLPAPADPPGDADRWPHAAGARGGGRALQRTSSGSRRPVSCCSSDGHRRPTPRRSDRDLPRRVRGRGRPHHDGGSGGARWRDARRALPVPGRRHRPGPLQPGLAGAGGGSP